MKKLLQAAITCIALSVAGCSSFVRVAGRTCTLRGVVQKESDGASVANVPIAISGFLDAPLFVRLIPGPISGSWREITTIRSDADGRFSFVAPYYASYRILAGAPLPLGGLKGDAKNLESADIVIRLKEPNQPPEPTR